MLAFASLSAEAQVVLDGTLRPGNEGLPPPNLAAIDQRADYLIGEDLGIRAGSNLLHSFEAFSLSDGERATFTGDSAIQNVIARVTGESASIIEGVLASEIGTADFFFFNAAGITFRNAQPDTPINKIAVPGSFFASTADALLFEGGERFEADGSISTAPDAILTGPSAWAFLEGQAADVVVDQTLDLRVPTGEVLGLVGGDVDVIGTATVRARTGSIEIAAVGADAASVPLDLETWDPPDSTLGEVRLSEGSTLTVRDVTLDGVPGGRVVLRGGRLVIDQQTVIRSTGDASTGGAALDLSFSGDVLLDDADLLVEERGSAGAGAISIAGNNIVLSGQSLIRSRSFEDAARISFDATSLTMSDTTEIGSEVTTGRGAAIDVQAGEVVLESGASITSRTFFSGSAGSIRIATETFLAEGIGTSVSSATDATNTAMTGNAGDLTIAGSLDGAVRANSITLREGAQIEAATLSDGLAGSIEIASDVISIEGAGSGPGSTLIPSGLFARSGRNEGDAGTSGDGGQIRVDAREIRATGAGTISVRSFGSGRSGTIELIADEMVLLQGEGSDAPAISAFSEIGDSTGVETETPAIRIAATRLEVLDGAVIDSDALAEGNAGDIAIEVDSLLIRGRAGPSASGISAQSSGLDASAGDGGNVRIMALGQVEIIEGGDVSVRSRGPGASGSIFVQADDDLRVTSGASIRSTAEAQGPAGNVTLISAQSVVLSDNASISSESLASADAGTISIAATDDLRIEGSRVDASADLAAGANITLSAGRNARIEGSQIETSVEGRAGEGNAGNLGVEAVEITVNNSNLLARATQGDGGRIDLVADRFLASADSLIDASSDEGIDGIVQIEAPDTNLRGELSSLTEQILDTSQLLRTPCAARTQGAGSFVVSAAQGLPRTPLVGNSLPLPLPARLRHSVTSRHGAEEASDLIDPLSEAPAYVPQSVTRCLPVPSVH